MTATELFDQTLSKTERQLMAELSSPSRIQAFLDGFAYSTEEVYRCPLRVLRERIAHCFDGALFAAAALRRIGFPPLILEILPNDRDDDHMLTPYKMNGHWGAVAKSNFVGLRFREAIYRTLRELVLSYFEQYYNVEREKTLRGYTAPLNLKAFDRFNWMVSDEPLEQIATRLGEIRKISVVTPQMIAKLSLVDPHSYQAGLLGAVERGLYRPSRRRH
jgi:hypothetical protein